jgi:hypothetical protein
MRVSQIIFQSWPTKDHFSSNFWTTVFLNGNMLEKYVIDKTSKNNIFIKNFICLDGYVSDPKRSLAVSNIFFRIKAIYLTKDLCLV